MGSVNCGLTPNRSLEKASCHFLMTDLGLTNGERSVGKRLLLYSASRLQ